MELIIDMIDKFNNFINTRVVPAEVLMIALLGTGLFLTLRLMFIQVRRLKHGIEVTTGKYDNPSEPGDVSHFQALTTALSATVGVGNIAGVAAAIHWGGPGALFWMWMTAFLGMAVKYSEVTLALKYRTVDVEGATKLSGSVSGGPMYYIQRGLGPKFKWLAVIFAIGLMLTSFMTGNAVQANTLTDLVEARFGINPYLSGLVSVAFVGFIIFGGIKRIGKVTSVLAPAMALIYVLSAAVILGINFSELFPALGTIVREAFSPTAGLAGTGAGAWLMVVEWGVKRGLFSNEAGQGSAPIAHSAAQTNEPVSEGVVALLEPFIDTLIICSITGLVIITTGVWNTGHKTELELASGDISYRMFDDRNMNVEASDLSKDDQAAIIIRNGEPQYLPGGAQFSWHEVPVERFYTDSEQTKPFNGTLYPSRKLAVAEKGEELKVLFGDAAETAAPLTSKAFGKVLGPAGEYIVLLCVILFAVSTAISWSYYGDRCANFLFGRKAIVPYKVVYLIFHYVGATAPLAAIWALGDTALSLVTLPNLLALILLSGVVARETRSYFDRKPWLQHKKADR